MDTKTPATDVKVDGQVAEKLRRLVDEAELMLRTTVDSGDRQFDAMRARFGQQLKRMRRELDRLEGVVVDKTRQATDTTDKLVHTYPYRAMGVATIIGMIAGLFFGRRG